MTNAPSASAAHIASRIIAGLLGSYGFVWGFVTLGIVLLVLAGTPYNEAVTTLYLLTFVLFLATFCWAFAAASLLRVWAILVGGGASMTALARLLIPSLA